MSDNRQSLKTGVCKFTKILLVPPKCKINMVLFNSIAIQCYSIINFSLYCFASFLASALCFFS